MKISNLKSQISNLKSYFRRSLSWRWATETKELVVVAQRDASHEKPMPGDFYTFGTKVVIRKIARGPEGAIALYFGFAGTSSATHR